MQFLKKEQIRLNGIKNIAIFADCGCVPEWQKTFPRLLKKVWDEYSPELFILAGDIALTGFYFDYSKIVRYMKPIPSRLAAVPGNHDRPAVLFRRFFGSVHKTIDVDKWRFICEDTSDKKIDARRIQRMQKDIRDNSIIIFHVPPATDNWSFYSLQDESSAMFYDFAKNNRNKIHAMYFGHIHGYSEHDFMGIPMIVTGGAAQSKVIKNNRYNEDTSLEMIIFDVSTGKISKCELD